MPLFGKPKRKKSIEVGKPRNVAEKYEVKRRLRKKYPQMFDKPEKAKGTTRQRKEAAALKGALSPAEIKRLKGKK
jgi:hypothetical protein